MKIPDCIRSGEMSLYDVLRASMALPTQLRGRYSFIGSAPTQQSVAAAFDLGDVARAIERYLPNNTGGSKAKPRKRA